mmetsp:Transcript_15838/g.13454  ORF Transcript_15838/g.13454 Transcript_15838/m.13454 type:complete len:107 (+) Transcript_15838:203-523(+)
MHPETSKCYAIKVFPQTENEKPDVSYLCERKFADFDHPSLIKVHGYGDKKAFSNSNGVFMASYTIMEYSPFPDFADILINYNFNQDERLARTYFHQLIEGLEYLHQ